MIGLLTLLATGFGVLWAGGVGLAAWMLTHPPRRTYGSAVSRGRPGDPSELGEAARPFERWIFRSRGLELPVWDIPGDDASGPTVIVTHGWADSRIGSLVRLGALAPVSSRIVAWDLPGHGEAGGACRLGTAEVHDLIALIEHLGSPRTVLLGWSLGAGVSLAAAARAAGIVGVVAEAPYRVPATPAANVLRARGLPASIIIGPALLLLRAVCGRGLASGEFDRARWAERAGVPVLVVHGTDDVVCPVQDGRDIAAAARGSMFEIAGGGHNDLWTEEAFAARCEEAVAVFVRSTGRTA